MERVQTDFQLAVGHLILAEIATAMIVIKVLNVIKAFWPFILLYTFKYVQKVTYSYIHNNI